MFETIVKITISIVAPVVLLFTLYFGWAFFIWVMGDPFDIIDLEPPYTEGEQQWNKCVRSTKTIFDDFNDTVGAHYALEDLPSQGVKEFMQYCLEVNR